MNAPELYLNTELSSAQRRSVQRKARAGELNRIAPGVFTTLPEDQWEALISRHRLRILGALFPEAVISYRSALAGGVPVDQKIYLSYSYGRSTELPGLRIVLVRGTGRTEGDMPLGQHLFLAGETRQLLENLTINRGPDKKAAGETEVENRLVTICEARGEAALNRIRDDARSSASKLGLQREFKKLEGMIGAILGSRKDRKPITAAAIALSKGEGYDSMRLERFDALASLLRARANPQIPDVAIEGASRANFALMESYFSNYIEGTKFSIEEAADIALRGKPVVKRPKDSKDIEGVFRHAFEPAWRLQTLATGESSLEQLRARHADTMAARPEVEPGQFKTVVNYAGNTEFVHPRHVVGTLIEGTRRLAQVPEGFARAVMAHFIVAEVHPFIDGNGRISRLLMNAELSAAGLCRIVIPTIVREEYLDALRLHTRQSDADPLIRFLERMQKWTSSFDYSDFASLESAMKKANAFEENPREFRLTWPTPQMAKEAAQR